MDVVLRGVREVKVYDKLDVINICNHRRLQSVASLMIKRRQQATDATVYGSSRIAVGFNCLTGFVKDLAFQTKF